MSRAALALHFRQCKEPTVEIHREREGRIFEYVLKLWVEGKQGQPVPEDLKPKIGKAFSELFDRVDSIFAEYEMGGPKVV